MAVPMAVPYGCFHDYWCSTLRQAPGLSHKHYTRLEKLAGDKDSCLLQKFVNYRNKKFYNIRRGVSNPKRLGIMRRIMTKLIIRFIWNIEPRDRVPTAGKARRLG
jgi:hypothetical protein